MGNVIPLAGAEAGDKIGPHVATRAIKVRQRQGLAMLEVSLALLDVKRHAENGGSMDDLSYNLDVLAKYLRDSAL